MERNIIRSVRKGSAQWNEDDRIAIATLLIKSGYAAKITHRTIPGNEDKKNAPKEYIIEYWEE